MPRILVYEECLAAGTTGPLGAALTTELLVEGRAMACAFAEDCAQVNGWHVRVARAEEFRDRDPAPVSWRWLDYSPNADESLDQWLGRHAAQADYTLVIAPECSGILEQRARAVVTAQGRLLGPDPNWIALTTDKTATLKRLAEASVLVPRGVQGPLAELAAWPGPYPAVLKPNDGVGAGGVRRIADRASLLAAVQELANQFPETRSWRCEEFFLGQAASVSVIAGAFQCDVLLPATQQVEFDEQGNAHYRGGAFTLTEQQRARAQKLGAKVSQILPRIHGYFGIDMILGDAVDGSQDAVLEVNPRLTTSYLGLRAVSGESLARMLLKSRSPMSGHIEWSGDRVEFNEQGILTCDGVPYSSTWKR